MADAKLRQRSNKSSDKVTTKNSQTPLEVEDAGRVISVIDVLRILVTVVVATLAVSYYTTSGESLIYGYKPWFLNSDKVKAWYKGPLQLTPLQLAKYDGNNADLPIYISINGTIYDVTQGRHMYGPGGGYHVFAGRDATRAFVTGCFQEDKTHDMRGAEEVYLPIEDVPSEKITKSEKKVRTMKERQEAKQRVHDEIKKWVDFFSNSPKYPTIGKVIGLDKPAGPAPRLCEYARKARPKRSAILAHQAAAAADAADQQRD